MNFIIVLRFSIVLRSSSFTVQASCGRPISRECNVGGTNEVTERCSASAVDLQKGYPVMQLNGQRQCGPPYDWVGPPPPKGTELFLRSIPRDWDENCLWPILSAAGNLYVLRLMMDFSGTNRGYAYARYATRADALAAAQILNKVAGVEVVESSDNSRLFIGNVNSSLSQRDLANLLNAHLDGVTNVDLVRVPSAVNKNFSFVEFEDHKSAALGRRLLLYPGIKELGQIRVDWAENPTDRGKVLRFGPFGKDCTLEHIEIIFRHHGVNLSSITKITSDQNSYLVEFFNRKAASNAYDAFRKANLLHLVEFDRAQSRGPQNSSAHRRSPCFNGQRTQPQREDSPDLAVSRLPKWFNVLNVTRPIGTRDNIVPSAQLVPALPHRNDPLVPDMYSLESEFLRIRQRLITLYQQYPDNHFMVLETLLGELGWGRLIPYYSFDATNSTIIELNVYRGEDFFKMYEQRDHQAMTPDFLGNSVAKLISVLFNSLPAYYKAKMAFGPGS